MNIFNIQHFSTGDGYGIRSTVFLCSCNLRCPWCHNPESIFGCGHEYTLDEVVDDVMGDIEFYRKSNGGVTISGGEPLCSIDDCIELAKAFKVEGLNVIVDTALAAECGRLEELAHYVDCFFVDVKTADPSKFAEICGGDFDVYTSNISRLQSVGSNIVLRIPLIPQFNMDDDSISDIIKFVKKYGYPITLLPFHRLGTAKYTELGLNYAYADTLPPKDAEVDAIRAKFSAEKIAEANV